MLKTQTGFKLLLSVKAISHLNDFSIVSQLGTLFSAILVEKPQHNISVIANTSKKFVCSIFSYATTALEVSPFVFNIYLHFYGVVIVIQNAVNQHFTIRVLKSNQSFKGELK